MKYVPHLLILLKETCAAKKAYSLSLRYLMGWKVSSFTVKSMVTVNPDYSQKLMDINVGGTKNMIECCLEHSECRKMIYVQQHRSHSGTS